VQLALAVVTAKLWDVPNALPIVPILAKYVKLGNSFKMEHVFLVLAIVRLAILLELVVLA